MPSTVDPVVRNNVHVTGSATGTPIMFAHGFGGSQESWRAVAPEFEADHPVILFDQAGSGGYDLTAYDRPRYDSLNGFADDVIEILDQLQRTDVIYVGHSVSGIIGALASIRRPDLFSKLIMIGPSPRYIDDGDYEGGFSQQAIDELLASMDSNYVSWSNSLAPVLMGNPDRPELADDLAGSIRDIDPAIAAQFARATFLGDNRRDLPDVITPTLILQNAEDNIASPIVGAYVHAHIAGSELQTMNTRGHVPHLSAPAEVTRHIRDALR